MPCQPPRRLADIASADGASPEDVLDVAAVNGQRWSDCRRRIAAWQNLAREVGWVNPQKD